MTDAKKKSTPAKKSSKETKQMIVKPSSSDTRVITLLIILIVVSMSAGLYWLWQDQKEKNIQQKVTNNSFNKQLLALDTQQQELDTQNINQIKSLQTFQETLRQNLTKIVQNNQYFRNDWLVSEAEYLIQLANYRLLLEKDVTTAIVALEAADVRLSEISDPALLKIREILKNDLQALNNVQLVDLAGLSITITALSNNIENLPLITPDPKTHKITQEVEAEETSAEVKSLKQLPAAIWDDIKSLIIVRNHQKPVKPLLAPEQHFFLLQNLALLFEQTRLALLNGNNLIYQERLQATTKWINQYFDPDHNITRNMLASIESLQKVDINPALPDISATFTSIRKYRSQGQTPEITSTKVKEK